MSRDRQLVINFGKKVKRLRKLKGLTQKDLCDITGINRYTLIKYEKLDEAPPSMETIISLCKALEISADYLLGLKDVDKDTVRREMQILSDASNRTEQERD